MRALRRAFTLVEVVLAILIISAIITVLLFFYQRSVEVRQTILHEAEYLSIGRMFLEQVTSDLRSARLVEDQFIGLEGTSNSITFVCTSIPQTARWIVSTNEAIPLAPATDLKRVTYRLVIGTNVTDIRGVDRVQEPLTSGAFTAGTNSTEFVSANAERDSNLVTTNDVASTRPPLTARIKHLNFRYWGGTNWLDNWSKMELPGGVEISIGPDPVAVEASPQPAAADEPALDLFRRVVYLPNSVPPANKVLRDPEPEEAF